MNLPPWLHEMVELVRQEGDEAARERWSSYMAKAETRWFLALLDLRFEPMEKVRRQGKTGSSIHGFELLGTNLDGIRYKKLLIEAKELGITRPDLDLALALLALRTVRYLRPLLQAKTGLGTRDLFFTQNLSQEMAFSPILGSVLDRYYDPPAAHQTIFELNENFAFQSFDREPGHEAISITLESMQQFLLLCDGHCLEICLDDVNAFDPVIRTLLADRAVMSKLDARYTARILELLPTAMIDVRTLLDELARFRIHDKRFVVEGVETEELARLIRANWPEEYSPTLMQGWAIKLWPPLDKVFEAVHTLDEPRGYRLCDWAREQVGVAAYSVASRW